MDLEATPHAAVKLALDGFTLDEAALVASPLLSYLAMIASLIEERAIASSATGQHPGNARDGDLPL